MLGRFVANSLSKVKSGTELDVDTIVRHLMEEQVGALHRSAEKLRLTMRDMGFVHKIDRRYVVTETFLPETAFLIMLHYHLAQEPTTITVSAVIDHPFWRYLGGRRDEEVRNALSHATAIDAISRYSSADNLEQITTRFSLEELLQERVRLESGY